MRTKHTKGEWRIPKGNSVFDELIIVAGGKNKPMLICSFPLIRGDSFIDNEQFIEANAKLIAVAPDLLEALIQIVHMDDELCKCPACKIGKPIIKKATQ